VKLPLINLISDGSIYIYFDYSHNINNSLIGVFLNIVINIVFSWMKGFLFKNKKIRLNSQKKRVKMVFFG
jgi:hypothetical protein